MAAAKRRSRSKSADPPPPPPEEAGGGAIKISKELFALREKAVKIQDALDHCHHRVLKSHVEFPKNVSVETVLEYARRVAYTTSAPLNYQPMDGGMHGQLCGQLPPAPQEEQFLVSKLKRRHEERLVQTQAMERKRTREEEARQRRRDAEAMAKLPKEEVIEKLMKWKPGLPWPEGVPKPPVGWKPGDPLAFLLSSSSNNSAEEEAKKSPVAAEKQPPAARLERAQHQQQLSLDFEDDEIDDDNDDDDGLDDFDFDVVSASDGGDDDSD